MSPKQKAEKVQAETLGLEEIDKDDLVVCSACGSVFDIDIAEICPRCKGFGNPGEDVTRDADGFGKDGLDKDGFDKDGLDKDGNDRTGNFKSWDK